MKYHLAAYHGGLGDWLQFGTLPERLTHSGHEVHLWEKAQFRNEQVRELILMNPYLLPPIPGAEWNLGDIPGLAYKNDQRSFIANWEAMFGLVPENDLPKIYYNHKYIGKFEGIIELSAIHHKFNAEELVRNTQLLVAANPDINWLQLVSPWQSNHVLIPGIKQLQIDGIFQLCDIINNCITFVSCMSGQHSLAAAIQRTNASLKQYCFIPQTDWKWVMESQKFVYHNVQYLPT